MASVSNRVRLACAGVVLLAGAGSAQAGLILNQTG